MNRIPALLSTLALGLAIAGCSTNETVPPRGSEATEADVISYRQAETEQALNQQLTTPLDAPLRLVEFAQPRYPSFLLGENSRSLRGNVTVSFEVLPSGFVGPTKVLSNTDEALNKPVISAIRNWRFAPLVRDGKPARLFLQHTIRMEP